MENFPLKNVVNELTQGREVAEQLQIHLINNARSSNSHETRDFLIQKIINSYDQALSLIKHGHPGGHGQPEVAVAASDGGDDSGQDLEALKKRKGVAKWTKKVKVCLGTEIKEQIDDGFAWRKYSQNDIFGTNYSRGCYRCKHKHSQGCLATKQVQTSYDDPTMYEITYKRNHTCTARADPTYNNNNDPPPIIPDPQNENPNPLPENPLQSLPQTNLNFQDLGPNENPSFETFNFPSPSTINPESNHIFSGVNDDLGNYSPNLMSQTFGSNYFPFGSSEFGSNFDFGNR